MAQSKSGSKSGASKTTYRSSGGRSTNAGKGKSHRSSGRSGTKSSGSGRSSAHKASGRAQRRAQNTNLGRSVALAGVGLLVIALVLVRGEGA